MLAAELSYGSTTARGEILDVSRHGLLIATANPPRERFLTQLTVFLPDGPLLATGVVSRLLSGLEGGGPAAGIELFAMAEVARRRWDRYVALLAGRRASSLAGAPAATSAASFLIKLPTVERLIALYEKIVQSGTLYLMSPVLREIDSEVAVVIIHPRTEREFLVWGHVVRVHPERPRGIEIQLQPLGALERARFAAFVEAPLSEPDPGPLPEDQARAAIDAAGSAAPVEESIAFDITVDLESLSEAERFEWEDVSEELIVDLDLEDDLEIAIDESSGPSAPAIAPLPEATRPAALRARVICAGCRAATELWFGAVEGPLEMLAERRAYFCPGCARIAAVTRLSSAQERRRRLASLGGPSGEPAQRPIPLALAFVVAELNTLPRCPDCNRVVRTNPASRLLEKALRRLGSERSVGPLELAPARCACGGSSWCVEVADAP
jgi:hypothetical protein